MALGCAQVWENLDGECAPDTSAAQLSCDVETNHQSDFCVCSGPVGDPPDTTSTTAAYNDLFTELVGYGASTEGGRDGSICTVTSLSDSGSGTLRHCVEDDPGATWVRFAVDGDITLASDIDVPSRTTIDARGHTIRIFGEGLDVHSVSHVVVTNLIFKQGTGGDDNDAIQVKDSQHIWLHHNSFSDYGDGLVDLTKGTTDVTVSWCKFSSHRKVLLISANEDHTEDQDTRVTLHHNWFRETWSRHPRLRHGRVHAYNNYFQEWGAYGMACSYRSECFVESNVFEAGESADAVITIYGDDSAQGEVEAQNDLLLNGATIDTRGSVFRPPYAYTPESTAGLAARIQATGGAR